MNILLLVLFVLLVNLSPSDGVAVGPFPKGVNGSGYGCDNQCNDGDVNYAISAHFGTYTIPGSRNIELFLKDYDIKTFVRTFTGINSTGTSPFCAGGGNGTSGPLGPCLTVNPGQTMKIKLINDLDMGMRLFGQDMVSQQEYWARYGQFDNVTFDYTNLHLHGVQVYPHLFYPEGTGDPTAPWIETTPATVNPDQVCHCYVFEIPDDHPQGTFLWHIHRHGATAMQGWQGMAGYLLIGDADTTGSPENDLAKYNVTRQEFVPLWEWVVDLENTAVNDTDTYMIGNFLDPNNEAILLTGNEYQPEWEFCVGETAYIRFLCAQTTTGSALYIFNEANETVPFWVFASDGVSYDKAYEKEIIVVAPGNRQDMLFQFNSTGTYQLMQQTFNDDLDSNNLTFYRLQLALTIRVGAVGDGLGNCPNQVADISSMVFTPGMPDKDILEGDIVEEIGVEFEVIPGANASFRVDGQLYDNNKIMKTMEAGSAWAWNLLSNRNLIHPFHIHVNPFQVIDIKSRATAQLMLPNNVTLLKALQNTLLIPPKQWHDTVFVAPEGQSTIWTRFGGDLSFTGKTVFHCHFLDHEDLGMMQAIMIADPVNNEPTPAPAAAGPTPAPAAAGPTPAPASSFAFDKWTTAWPAALSSLAVGWWALAL